MALVIILVYPLDGLGRAAARALGQPSLAFFFAIFTTGLPSLLVWGVAVWVTGQSQLGLASGLSVGLLAVCLTLKAVSFTQFNAHATSSLACMSDGKNRSGEGEEKGQFSVLKPAAIEAPSLAPKSDLPAPEDQLYFGEFLFFILAAPSLVCELRFIKASARRSSRLWSAASEFFHAGLTFFTLHAACSAFFAPAMRVLAVAATARQELPDGISIGQGQFRSSSFVNYAGWATLRAGGSGAWLTAFFPDLGDHEEKFDIFLSDGSVGWLQILVAASWSIFFLSPMVHFMTFYGFWHCVCLGFAELWGFPDRNFYGKANTFVF